MKKTTDGKKTTKEKLNRKDTNNKDTVFQKLAIEKNEYYDEVSTYDAVIEALEEVKKNEHNN